MSERTERGLLLAILGLFVLLGAIYSVVVPPFEASDEKWHYPMVKTIADHWRLPVQEPGIETPWRQEGSQPPLYYALTAAATFWIDTGDMETVRHLNPHVDPGATPDGNVNLVVHHPAREAFPWTGTVLAVHLIRFLSVLMGVAAVYLTYLIVREVVPDAPLLALGAAAVHAFTPMVIFISASVNNDSLVVPLSSLALLMLLRLLRDPNLAKVTQGIGDAPTPGGRDPSRPASRSLTFARFSLGRYLLLGLVLALAALTKTSSLALTVLTALVVIVRAVRRRSWAEFFTGGLATLLPVLLVAGWWYVRNLQLYGDLFGLNVFIEILGQRDVPADLAQLWRERYSFAAGYWGNFGGLNVPMPPWTYRILNTLAILAALGLLVLLLRTLFTAKHRSTATPSSVVGRPSSVIRRSCLLDIGHWTLDIVNCSLFLLLLWGLGVLVPWSRWAAITWSSQGRLIFTALPVWSLLLILGLSGWLPWRWGRWLVVTFALFLLALSVVAPWAWIAPAYAQAEPLTGGQVAAISHRVDAEFGTAERGAVVRLLGYDLRTEVVQPGGEVEMTLYWEALAPTDRDYTVFVHLLGEGELLVAQRDTFPGLGRLSTTWLEPGFRWADHTVVQVPATAYAPDLAPVEVGLYDVTTGARLPVTDPDGQPLDDNVRFGQVEIRPRPGDVPNPISVNFDDRMALIGYDLDRRVVRPGDAVTLTLHWRGLERMDVNYTVSTQLVDAGQRKAAQQDSWPLDGAAPTAAWEPEQALADVRTLRIFPDAPPGVYHVRVTVYVQEQGEIIHLPIIPEGGRMLADHVLLNRVRVVP